MSPPTVKITRSRTASARLKSNGQHSTKESLREIIRRADAGDCSKKKRNKNLAGVRFADIGGGDLTSTMVLDDKSTTSQPAPYRRPTGSLPAPDRRPTGIGIRS